MSAMKNNVDDWFGALNDNQAPILRDLRRIILNTDQRIVEELKWGQPCYSLGSLFCYLQKAKRHVTLGFQAGTRLSDPHGLLQGDGKDMRHVKIFLGETLDKTQMTELIAKAVSYALKRHGKNAKG